MEEFTNGAFIDRPHESGENPREMRRFDAYCPYCGWVYDRPEELVPSHASCSHLVAAAQWSAASSYINAAAFLDNDGQWKFWMDASKRQGKEMLERAFGKVTPKVVSSTARFENPVSGDKIFCRFYFSRRPRTAASELSAAEPAAPRLTFARIRGMNEAGLLPCCGRVH